ncbi:uncharacterized protein LOC144263882 isoform X2 [Eretmochelys imbricata]
MQWPGRQEKVRKLLNFSFLFAWSPAACHAGQSSSAEVTMQSLSAEVTMMESQNHKRAPAWIEWEGMKDRGHNRDLKQCHVKLKELRQAYQKTRQANGRSGSEPQTCRSYDDLHAILGGSAITTPAVLFDSFNGDGGNTEAGFGDKEDDDDEVVDSSQQASGETSFPDSQELFLTLDLEPVPPRTHPRLPPGPARRRRDLCCMCFKDHMIFSFPEASED